MPLSPVHDEASMTATTPRTTLRPKFIVVAVAFLFLLVAIPAAIRYFTLFPFQAEVSVAVAVGTLILSILLVRVLHSCYHWVELDRCTIRGRKLVTRRISEWEVRDIVSIRDLSTKDLGLPEIQVSGDHVLGSRHGYELRF